MDKHVSPRIRPPHKYSDNQLGRIGEIGRHLNLRNYCKIFRPEQIALAGFDSLLGHLKFFSYAQCLVFNKHILTVRVEPAFKLKRASETLKYYFNYFIFKDKQLKYQFIPYLFYY